MSFLLFSSGFEKRTPPFVPWIVKASDQLNLFPVQLRSALVLFYVALFLLTRHRFSVTEFEFWQHGRPEEDIKERERS